MPLNEQHSEERKELAIRLQEKDILSAYLGGKSTQEIAEEMGVTRQNVEYHLNHQKSDFSFQMLELTENLAIVSLGRLEFIIKMCWPMVANGDLRAMKTLIDVTKLEMEWRDRIVPKNENPETITMEIEKFEQTMTGNAPLYSIALENLQEDWMRQDEISLDSIYSEAPAKLPDDGDLMKRINKVEQKMNEMSEEDENETG